MLVYIPYSACGRNMSLRTACNNSLVQQRYTAHRLEIGIEVSHCSIGIFHLRYIISLPVRQNTTPCHSHNLDGRLQIRRYDIHMTTMKGFRFKINRLYMAQEDHLKQHSLVDTVRIVAVAESRAARGALGWYGGLFLNKDPSILRV